MEIVKWEKEFIIILLWQVLQHWSRKMGLLLLTLKELVVIIVQIVNQFVMQEIIPREIIEE